MADREYNLRDLLRYDQDSGQFYWLDNKRNGMNRCGKPAGWKARDGYCMVKVCYVTYMVHRLAWFFHYGEWPKKQIDHINGIRDDNRIANLRQASYQEQQQNVKVRKDNTSGFTGVSLRSSNNWVARIKHSGQEINLGTFRSPESAHRAYLKAKRSLHTFQPIPRCLMERSDG